MQPPSDSVRSELEPLLRANQKRLGQVYRLMDRGWPDPRIAAELGVDSSNFVSNNRNTVRAILEGRLPNGPAMATQIASAVRGLTRNVPLSPETTAYVDTLLQALTAMSTSAPSRAVPVNRVAGDATTPAPPRQLRTLVDNAIKQRVTEMERRLVTIGIDPDDYHAVVTAEFSLDVVERLVSGGAMSRTTRELVDRDRLDLSMEQAVLEWSADLPLASSLVDDARGRLDYWRSQ
ncbi:hypothetical protein [Nocardioides sp. ChNu-99]|uniref:hypothetical protein n=1 Tax=Nocardioides sp. ChNu-99 TaxID=2839897 RepID=UPI00240697ED|nr:hypothetical protein [Nocardioides sp. ChNu-99]MDF9717346.1 hypothetical protein [Nocardioides sp. ChNu-99]